VAGLQKTPGIIFKARREIKTTDIIHLHNYRTFQNIAVHYYAQRYGIPYVLQAHGSLPRILSKKALKQAFDICWGKALLRDAARVIAVTEIEAEQYRNAGVREDKIAVIPHGIAPDEFAHLPERGEFRKKHGLAEHGKIILYLGRIHKIKGLDLLLKVFAELTGETDNITLVIAGPDDGYLRELKKLAVTLEIDDKVIFPGALYEQEKLGAYVDADIYVLPSVYEIFGITLLEALACGTPVVTTDRCGLADVIKDKAGLVVSYDPKQLQDALERLLQDDRLRREFGGKGKTMVQEEFNWAKIAVQIEKVYTDILK